MTKLGVNFPSRVAFEAALKKPLDAGVRCYTIADARKLHAEGRKVTFSYKPTVTFAQAAAGQEDQKDLAIINEVASWGPGHTLAKQHEPENDGQPAADFVAMTKRWLGIATPILHGAGSRTGICLMGQTFKDGPAPWIGTNRPDVMGADPYLWRGASGPYAPTEKAAQYSAFDAFLAYCTTNNYPAELWEFGCSRTQADTQGIHRAEELEKFAAKFKDKFAAVFYFESPPPVVDWEIRTEPRSMAAFGSLASGAVVEPPPGETDAQKIARLTAELATATAQVSQLTAANKALTDEIALLKDALGVSEAILAQIHDLSAPA